MVSLARQLFDEIVGHAQRLPDQEVCGILGGRDGRVERVYRMRNVAQTPATRFDFHPKDFMNADDDIRSAGLDIVGFYHSHIASSPYPSRTDVKEWNPEFYPDAVYFICSLKDPIAPQVRAFRFDEDRHLVEEPIVIEG